MGTIFVVYMLYAAVILIWSSLHQSSVDLRHIIISPALLKESALFGQNTIVFELRPARPDLPPIARVPGTLLVSSAELYNLVRWISPGATLVFHEHGVGRQLDSRFEQALLDMDINVVYWLESHADSEFTADTTCFAMNGNSDFL